jgi:hypothetical protein
MGSQSHSPPVPPLSRGRKAIEEHARRYPPSNDVPQLIALGIFLILWAPSLFYLLVYG